MAPLEFDTAIARAARPDDEEEVAPYTLTVNERDPDTDEIVNTVDLHAYEPDEGQVAVFLADTSGRRATTTGRVAGTIDFFMDALDPPSSEYVTRRLLDRHDPFSMDDIVGLAHKMLEAWGGRPTKRPTDFQPSQKPGGPRSTRTTRKSTSSASRRTAT